MTVESGMRQDESQDEQRVAIGERVQRARESLGWSQATLGRNAGVSENTILSIEKGKHRTQPEKLRQVLDALGLAPIGDPTYLSMGEVPKDVQLFLTVVAHRLAALEEGPRTRLLNRVYPMLIVDDLTA